ncbi:MAG: CHAD domain-containing protein [Actinobacteria bacterium]|nr:CHAD domain-containing protein [Actinomycetota bacterium]
MPPQDDHRDLSDTGARQFARVRDGLAGRPDRDTGTHEARKALKRLRALLRLARLHLGKGAFRRHDLPLRDLGRALADVRDTRVALDLLDAVAGGRCPALRSRLEERYASARAALEGDPGALETLAAGAGEAGARWRDDFGGAPVAWEGGMRRTLRRAAARYVRARERGRDDDFHEWRKEVKHLRYQAEELGEAGPDVPGGTAALEALGESLGGEHDLTVLIGLVEAEEGCGGERGPVLALLRDRRAALRGEALAAGGRLFGGDGTA